MIKKHSGSIFLFLLVGSDGGCGVNIYLYFLNLHEKLVKESVVIFYVHVGVTLIVANSVISTCAEMCFKKLLK